MDKKVLIITSRSEKTVAWKVREQYVKDFCEAVGNHLEDVTVLYTTYKDLRYTVRDGQTSIVDVFNDIDLKKVHFVHFKNWAFDTGEAPVVAAYLKLHGVPFHNSEAHIPLAPGKLAQMFRLSVSSIPVPDTFFASKGQLYAIFQEDNLPESFKYPLIMKANDGSRGDDNHFIKDAKEALDVLTASDPEKEYVLQNFIPNDGDYRLLFIGLDESPLVFHRTAAPGSHLNNTSKGGLGKFIDINTLDPAHVRYARRSAEVMGREIAGVDLLIDKETNKGYILEINGTPALATGYGVDVKAKRFAEFLKVQLEAQEEE